MGPLASSNRFAIHREAVTDHVDDPIVAWATVGYTIQRSRSPATAFAFCARAVVRCSALFGSVPRLWADRLGSVELQQLNRCSIVKYERHANSSRWLRRCDQNLPTFQSFVQIVDGKGDVRNDSDDLGHVAMRLEPDPLDPVGTGLKTGDVNPERRDMMLPSARLRVWNPDMVVPPSELRCHGRRLMVQSLSASHASLHRSRSPISIIESFESAERERDKPRLALNDITAGGREREGANRTRGAGHLDEISGAVANPLEVFRNWAGEFHAW